jgi:uncharacterized membrane protein (DUF485 family)
LPTDGRSGTPTRIRLTVYKASHIVRNRQGKRERRRVESNNEWVRVERTSAFKELVQRKRAFIIPATIFFMLFYFGLPFLAAFTTVLNVKVIGPLTLAYIYAFAQFAMTWILMHLYVRQANKWDDLVDRARVEAAEEVEGAR